MRGSVAIHLFPFLITRDGDVQSHKTASINHKFWGDRWVEVDPKNLGSSAYQPNALLTYFLTFLLTCLPLDQNDSQLHLVLAPIILGQQHQQHNNTHVRALILTLNSNTKTARPQELAKAKTSQHNSLPYLSVRN